MSSDQSESYEEAKLNPSPSPLTKASSEPEEPAQRGPDDAVSRAAPPSDPDNKVKRAFLWNTHSYLNEYVRFGDTKAGFTGTIAVGLLGALYSAGLHRPLLAMPVGQWTVSTWAAAMATIALIASIVLVVVTVTPRLRSSDRKGFIYWRSIAAHEDVESLKAAYEAQSADKLDDYLLRQLFELSKNVCVPKYRYVSLSLWALCVGGLLGCAALFLQDIPSPPDQAIQRLPDTRWHATHDVQTGPVRSEELATITRVP